MIKYLVVGLVLLVSPAALGEVPKKKTNYDKIVAEWSSKITKQTHNIKRVAPKKNVKKKNNYTLLLQQWKTEIRKINTNSKHEAINKVFGNKCSR